MARTAKHLKLRSWLSRWLFLPWLNLTTTIVEHLELWPGLRPSTAPHSTTIWVFWQRVRLLSCDVLQPCVLEILVLLLLSDCYFALTHLFGVLVYLFAVCLWLALNLRIILFKLILKLRLAYLFAVLVLLKVVYLSLARYLRIVFLKLISILRSADCLWIIVLLDAIRAKSSWLIVFIILLLVSSCLR